MPKFQSLTTALLASALAAGAFAVPAHAKSADEAAASESANAPAGQNANGKAKAGPRYCILEEITGTRIPTKTCLTQKEWLKRGVDVTQLK